MALRRIGVLLAVIALAATACSPKVTPEPSTEPAASVDASPTPGPIAETTPTPEPSEPPVPEESNPTSADLIAEAVENGTLDEATGYLYRFYAQWFDPRLPERYRGEAVEDDSAFEGAMAAYSTFSADQQALLRPFLVRPTEPESYFNSPEVAAASVVTARAGRTGSHPAQPAARPAAAAPVAAADCEANEFHREDLAIPVTVWARCLNVNGTRVYTLQSEVATLVRHLNDLWPKEKGLMGDPIGDKFNPRARFQEPPEANDGRIDVYLIETAFAPYSRDLNNPAKGMTYPAGPFENGTSSGYIVLNPYHEQSNDSERKANVAHELFHVFQNKYNQAGKYHCPYPNVAGSCSNKVSHWFVEASAAWAEHYFVTDLPGRQPDYRRFVKFLANEKSLSDTRTGDGYLSWVWPLFMEQETGSYHVIADVWQNLVGVNTWAGFQQAVNSGLAFDTHFRDFAVRVWQEELDGHPFKRFQEWYPEFPPTTPRDVDAINEFFRQINVPAPRDPIPRFKSYVDIKHGETRNFTVDIPELWAAYYDISPDAATRRLEFVFSGLTPRTAVDVDVLVRIDDEWQHRPLSGAGTIQFCLDKPADAIDEVILVLSNHEMDANRHVTGTWNVWADPHGCLTAGDSLTYESTYTIGTPASDYYVVTKERLSVTVKLKSGFGGSSTAFPFVNNNSTYSASFEQHSVLTNPFGCPDVFDSVGGGSGTIAGDDGVVGWVMQQDDGSWLMSIATGAEVQTTDTNESCLGTSTMNSTRGISFPVCDGVEVAGSNQTKFKFNCTHTGDWTWSLTGTISVQR